MCGDMMAVWGGGDRAFVCFLSFPFLSLSVSRFISLVSFYSFAISQICLRNLYRNNKITG